MCDYSRLKLMRVLCRSCSQFYGCENVEFIVSTKEHLLLCPRPRGQHVGIARSVLLSVPWRSCLGYRHAGCLLPSHCRLPEMCGLRTRPRTDVDPPPQFLPPPNCHWRGRIVSPPPPGYTLVSYGKFVIPSGFKIGEF